MAIRRARRLVAIRQLTWSAARWRAPAVLCCILAASAAHLAHAARVGAMLDTRTAAHLGYVKQHEYYSSEGGAQDEMRGGVAASAAAPTDTDQSSMVTPPHPPSTVTTSDGAECGGRTGAPQKHTARTSTPHVEDLASGKGDDVGMADYYHQLLHAMASEVQDTSMLTGAVPAPGAPPAAAPAEAAAEVAAEVGTAELLHHQPLHLPLRGLQ